jgi:putative PIN family toxin of toxin-antitoxin system
MRVIVDTNVFISYLLKSEKEKTIPFIIEAGFKGAFTFIVPHDVLREFNKKLSEKSYLAKKISREEADKFVVLLSLVSDTVSSLQEPLPEIVRDKKDDYLLAYGTVGECDYLVTGDADLLFLKQVGKVKIVSPAAFYHILKSGVTI